GISASADQFLRAGARTQNLEPSLFAWLLLLLSAGYSWSVPGGIVGGHEAPPHSRPYMASLQIRKQQNCGGVLVREDFVLTAAHCSGRLTVVLGAHSISQREVSQQIFRVQKHYRHPSYREGILKHDIMLLKLDRNATLNSYVQPIPVKSSGDVAEGTVCSTAGWGYIGNNGTYADKLQEVETTVLSRRECYQRWKRYIRIDKSMTCATDHGAFKGFCEVCNANAYQDNELNLLSHPELRCWLFLIHS
ncbi:mast cell protease 1A-like, partial [Polyodon spathula]|uniref:mast cell protease 1A-like n=1 Tax=Polyodon spathula TaxID=7913 RepID=UPI001B7F1CE3